LGMTNTSTCSGAYITTQGTSMCMACSMGRYCPVASTVANLCATRSYCALLSKQTLCSPGQYCPAGSCGAGNYCLKTSVQLTCEPGFYCPSVLQQLVCPNSFYCPSASVSPVACTQGMYCVTQLSAPRW
jgi:hypothetical protein